MNTYRPLPDPETSDYDVEKLGYDPRPGQMDWHNTPIPRVDNPLPATPELIKIAKSSWWNGEPWTILRNRYVFLRHAIDYASHEHVDYLWDHIPREDWIKMLETSRPGQVSTRSWRLYRMLAGLDHVNIDKEWFQPLHIKDQLYAYEKTWEQLRKEYEKNEKQNA